jgi:uncharacterized protein (DUF1697 family)
VTRYAAFLRAVNLGSVNKVAMPRLRAMAEGLGYAEVRTYINSGNLLFRASGTELELTTALEQAITDEFDLRIDVAVRTEAHLRALLDRNPFPDGEPSQVTVAFLTRPPSPEAEQQVARLAGDRDSFLFSGLEVWVNYTQGQGTSKLAAQFSKAVGVSSTVRTVRTVTKVVELFD